MIREPVLTEDVFEKKLLAFFDQFEGTSLLQKLRKKAWERFLELGLPSKKAEVFRYVPLRKLFVKDVYQALDCEVLPESIEKAIYPECRDSVIVLVNGRFSAQLSRLKALPERLEVISLREGAKKYGAFLTNHWNKTLKEENDAFAVLNAALHPEGVFVYIPPKAIVEVPIQILHVVNGPQAHTLCLPRLQFFVGSASEVATVSSQLVLSGVDHCVNSVVDYAIEDHAHVRLVQSQSEEQSKSWRLEAVRVSLKKNSTFQSVVVTEGSETVRNDYKVVLLGENAEASLNGVSMLSSKNESHTHILIEHQAPFCRSRQMFKTVLADTSRSSFEGKIYVHQAAQKTDAFQRNSNLLLSDHALAYSKPNLEIFADDVKASHGATFGQLDPEQLFMMKSRGIPQKQAQGLLVHGFCKEVVDLVGISSVAEQLSGCVQRFQGV